MFLKRGTRVERIFLTLEAYDMRSRGSHKLFTSFWQAISKKRWDAVLIECEEVVRSSPTDVVLVHFGGRSRWDPLTLESLPPFLGNYVFISIINLPISPGQFVFRRLNSRMFDYFAWIVQVERATRFTVVQVLAALARIVFTCSRSSSSSVTCTFCL